MRLLLINPKFPESFWSFKWVLTHILPGKGAINPPLGLATLAALCPEDWQIEIVDENIESIPLEPQADLIGICGMGVQFKRQKELLSYYRGKGYFVVAGGSYASLCPEQYQELADVVIAGEAEYIWRRFCRDFENGAPQRLYQESGIVSLADSPTPRFDLLKLKQYTTVTLQFSRGCPFLCEFCDIIVMFGRKPRWKSLEQVGRELDELRSRKVSSVFFVDDNLIGNKKAAKELLSFLKAYQTRHGYRFQFGTEASLNLAQDAELLQLFREANFAWLFIGIESPDEKSLKETRKVQNLHEDILTSVRKIYSYGIDVLAGFIIGFDNDTLATFERQRKFIITSGIQAAMIGLLTALPRTPLYERLEKEGRLILSAENNDNTKLGTNFLPKRMQYDAMVSAYKALYECLLEDCNIAERIRNKMRYLQNPVYQVEYSPRERWSVLWRLLSKGLLPGGIFRLYHFFHSLPWLAPSKLPQAILDWIAALAMRNYVQRHFSASTARQQAKLLRLCERLQAAIAAYAQRGRAIFSLNAGSILEPRISLSLAGWLDRDFFVRAGQHLERLLKQTPSKVTLCIETLHEQEVRHLQRLLKRLAKYGDRISIVVHDNLQQIVRIDSSIFHLVLIPAPAVVSTVPGIDRVTPQT